MPKIDQRQFAALLILGLAARVILTATTIGTNDVVFNVMWARLVDAHGVARAYAFNHDLNHPPLSLLLMHGYDLAARAVHAQFTDVYRFAQSLADVVSALALLRIGTRLDVDARFLSTAYYLSPAAIFISAFHCNTDSTMIALLLLATMFVIDDRAIAAGAFIAAAAGIKIVAFFVLPFLFVTLARRRAGFAIAAALVTAAIFLLPAWIGGPAVLRNIFMYSGFPGKWGLTAILLALGSFPLAYAYAIFGKYVLVAGLLALFVFYLRGARTASALCASIAIVYSLTIFLAPGFGVQYLIWPLPLLPIAVGKRLSLTINAATSAYLFMTYTIWSRGLPWWYADSIARTPYKVWITILGLPLWALFGYAVFRTVRCSMRLTRGATTTR
jgi:hypothetical protein